MDEVSLYQIWIIKKDVWHIANWSNTNFLSVAEQGLNQKREGIMYVLSFLNGRDLANPNVKGVAEYIRELSDQFHNNDHPLNRTAFTPYLSYDKFYYSKAICGYQALCEWHLIRTKSHDCPLTSLAFDWGNTVDTLLSDMVICKWGFKIYLKISTLQVFKYLKA